MNTGRFDQIFRQTLEDMRMSRGEKQALAQVVADLNAEPRDLAVLRSRAFALAREETRTSRARAIIDWLEEVVRVLEAHEAPERRVSCEAYFSPGDHCVNRIVDLMNTARRTIDICVYTITDNRISDAIVRSLERRVEVRIITDDRKAAERGSDIGRFVDLGIPVALDEIEKHMHHKFALFDHRTVVTGSYNWTRSASTQNEENIIVSTDADLVRAFSLEFESLWKKFYQALPPAAGGL